MPKILINGQEMDAREEPFHSVREEWNEYALADGVRVRVKVIPQKIFRLLDAAGQPALTPDGDPSLFVRSMTIVSASA